MASIYSLNISSGGVPKLAVPESLVTFAGLTGDWQKNRKYHGGPERALCLYALERIEALVAEGHRVGPGALGENVTVAGLAWDEVVPGVRLRFGRDVVVEVASFTKPCRTIAGVFADGRPVRDRILEAAGFVRASTLHDSEQRFAVHLARIAKPHHVS